MITKESVAIQAWLDGMWLTLEDFPVELAYLSDNDVIEAPEDDADRDLNIVVKRMAMIMLAEIGLRQQARETLGQKILNDPDYQEQT